MKIWKIIALTAFAAGAAHSGHVAAAPAKNLENVTINYKGQALLSVSENTSVGLSIGGAGVCTITLTVTEPGGYVRKLVEAQARTLPFTDAFWTEGGPGSYVVNVETVDSAATPSCAGGQSLTAALVAFERPRCPPHWEEVDNTFSPVTGAISCTPKKKKALCTGAMTQPFQSYSLPGTCNIGCQQIAY